MTIPTQMSLAGFIASTPQLTLTSKGDSRFYAKIGVEHSRREPDGSFTDIDPTFHDLVLYRATSERAYARFRKGDRFIAHGHINEYEVGKDGQSVPREEFVGNRIGHDVVMTRYQVDRQRVEPTSPVAEAPRPAVGI